MTDDSSEAAEDGIEPAENALPPEKLNYPEFVFEEGSIDADGGFDLTEGMKRDEIVSWLRELADGLESHDIAVESPDGHVTFGVGTGDVRMQFDPDENHQGTLSVEFGLKAKAMFVSDDPTRRKTGARGKTGFIPLSMLTDDKPPESYRCYSWIRDPTDP